jgi:hypothetical protein
MGYAAKIEGFRDLRSFVDWDLLRSRVLKASGMTSHALTSLLVLNHQS